MGQDDASRFAKTFRSSPMGFVIRRIRDQRAIEINDRFLELTGYRREDIVGKTTIETGIETEEQFRQRSALYSGLREVPFHRRSGELRIALDQRSGNFIDVRYVRAGSLTGT